MAPTPALASTVAAAMARASPKKPWRFYYVVAFPLSNAPSSDKLAGMLELTDSIERREEAYLHRMLDRDSPPDRDERASPLARYTATTLLWLSMLMALAALVTVVGVYQFQITPTGDDLDPRVLTASYAIAASMFVQNAMLVLAVRLQSPLLLRVCVLILSVAIGGVVFLLDEMDAVLFSQQHLAFALTHPRTDFRDAQIGLVLNGGAAPSLWHRFLVDGPAWFLLWLERRCDTGTQSGGSNSEDESLVDTADFFTPLWSDPTTRECAQRCLSTHLHIELVLQGVLTGAVVVMAAQLTLTLLLLWINQFDDGGDETDANPKSSNRKRVAISRKRKRRRRKQQPPKRESSSGESPHAFPLAVSSTGLVRVACIGLALVGGALTAVGLALLMSCSFVGPTESWTLVLIAVFGALQVLVALCSFFVWRQQLVKSLLVGGLALESYVTSGLTTFSVSLSASPLLNKSSFLQDAYDTVFQQTCQPMKHWRVHVCVSTSDATLPSPYGVAHAALRESPTCQKEWAALLRATTQHALVLLSWMMAAQITVLVWLLLPSVRALLYNLFTYLSCRSSTSNTSISAKGLQQKSAQLTAANTKRWKHTTLSLADARRLYLSTMKRCDAPTLQTEANAFDAEWTKMSRSSIPVMETTASGSVMFTHQFEAIVRTLVLRRLTVQCKLDVNLSVSSDGALLLARIFASDNLLMTTLCQCGPSYKLQLADAVDPGDAFWRDPREIKSDAKVLDTHTVHQKFKLLQLHSVITRKEAEIFPAESSACVSARVHALLRIHRWRRGELAVANRHAPFVQYMPQRQLQYLYKRYPNRLDTATTAQQRRAAVLRTIDCLRLTRQILDAEFDLDLMRRHGLVHACTELHSASRFDVTSRASLLTSWVAFWRPRHLPGEFTAHSHWMLHQLGRVSPFRQPLQAVRDYFGECLAFYFAWLACYSQWLLVPTLATIVLLATQTLDVAPLHVLLAFCTGEAEDTSTPSFTMSPSALACGLAVVAWGTAFAKSWERRSVWYQLEWGMDSDSDTEAEAAADRANYRGERRRNPVTQQLEIHFSGRTRFQRQLASAVVIVIAGSVHLVVCLLLLLAQGPLTPWLGLRFAVGGSCLIVALLVLWNGDAISALAHQLSEYENYQNERAFQRGVIAKVCLLQLFNSYGPLLLIAFVVYHTGDDGAVVPLPSLLHGWTNAFHTHVASHVGVVVELQLLLALVFATRILSHVLFMAHGLLQESLRPLSPTSSPPSVESELALQAYRGSYEDYTEIVVQLGLVAMFSSVFPIAPVFAFVECALELRLDALDLCLFLQRPTPDPASGIGPWTACVRGVLALAAVVNLALLYFVADNYAAWSVVRRVGAFLASALGAWVAAQLFWVLVPSSSRDVQRVRARHAFLVEKYFGGGGVDGGVDVEKTQGETTLRETEWRALATKTASDADDGKDGEDDEATPAHYHERLALLRRLNTALRKHDETLEPETVEATAPPLEEEEKKEEEEGGEEEEEEERAVVGYFVRRDPPPQSAPNETSQAPAPVESPPPTPPPPPPTPFALEPTTATMEATPPPPTVDQYERTALEGLAAISVAAERERFDFTVDTDWQQGHQEQQEQQERQSTGIGAGERRGSFSQSLTRRFSLFRKRRASMDDAQLPSCSEPTTQAPPPPAPTPQHRSESKQKKKHPASRSRESSGSTLPVVQLSGLEAVHEAARRDQFDFSTDAWRASGDATAP